MANFLKKAYKAVTKPFKALFNTIGDAFGADKATPAPMVPQGAPAPTTPAPQAPEATAITPEPMPAAPTIADAANAVAKSRKPRRGLLSLIRTSPNGLEGAPDTVTRTLGKVR